MLVTVVNKCSVNSNSQTIPLGYSLGKNIPANAWASIALTFA